jgi:uncharacterized membrane protein YcaP (DUF421 family)
MNEVIETVWGKGENLNALQMSARAVLMFFICLVIIRIGGIRTFGKKSAFDNILVIILGAILARGVIGASDYWATVMACLSMALLHRLLAWVSIFNPFVEKVLKGRSTLLYENGKLYEENLRKSSMSLSDVMESLRLETHQATLDGVEKAWMETNGRISFLLKQETKAE